MIIIDCANDNEIAAELGNYLKNHGFDAKTEESSVIVNEANVEKSLGLVDRWERKKIL